MATTSTTLTATNSFSLTPQAQGDVFYYSEDLTTVVTLDVMANDLGGAAKTLYSLDNGIEDDGTAGSDLLIKDGARAESTSGDTSAHGAKIWITSDGKVGYDAATLTSAFKAQLQALSVGETLCHTFTYAIRLANGTLSWTTAPAPSRPAATRARTAPRSGSPPTARSATTPPPSPRPSRPSCRRSASARR